MVGILILLFVFSLFLLGIETRDWGLILTSILPFVAAIVAFILQRYGEKILEESRKKNPDVEKSIREVDKALRNFKHGRL